MNKKILAIAVVAAMTAPMAAMADATVYGKAHLTLDSSNTDNGYNGWDVNSRASRLGVKGSEDLGDGLKAIYKMEFGVTMADGNTNVAGGADTPISLRNTYVGLKGDWGTFVIGRHDTPYKMSSGRLDMFGDTTGDYNSKHGGIVGVGAQNYFFDDKRADNALAYISPNMSGLTLAGAIVPTGGSTANGTTNNKADGLAEGLSMAGMYSQGPFYASAAYERFADTLNPAIINTNAADDYTKWRLGLGYTMDAFKVGFVYEDQDGFANDSSTDKDSWMLNGAYTFGNNTLKLQYMNTNFGNGYASLGRAGCSGAGTCGVAVAEVAGVTGDSVDQWSIALDHKFTKRTKVYAMYTAYDSNSADVLASAPAAVTGVITQASSSTDNNTFSLGMVHSF